MSSVRRRIEFREEIWRAARHFDDMLALNKKFIKGELEATPYYGGPLDDETKELIPGLLRLHDLRVFTFGSQPFEHGFRLVHDTSTKSHYKWVEDHQLPVIYFVMAQEDNPLKVFRNLRTRRDINTYAEELFPYAVVEGSCTEDIVVTRCRESNSWFGLKFSKWQDYSGVGLTTEKYIENFWTDYEVWKKIQPWVFCVVGKSHVDLVEIIARAVLP